MEVTILRFFSFHDKAVTDVYQMISFLDLLNPKAICVSTYAVGVPVCYRILEFF